MKLIIVLVTITGLSLDATYGQESKTAPSRKARSAALDQTNTAAAAASPEQLEAKFKSTLNKATLVGRWCSVQNDKLGADKEDKYTILGVNKVGGDVWLINARIQYGGKDITAPIPVKVKWAGDTAVIIVDEVGVSNSGSYSARLLIYKNTYAGSWSGGDHGGLMNGIITHEKE
ncbi:MAG: hypothetical protein QOF48_189 [Verrucomicrobiota bacterium]|jgi:hypothetical protein